MFTASTVCHTWTHLDTFEFIYRLVWKYFDPCFQIVELKLRAGNDFLNKSLIQCCREIKNCCGMELAGTS